MKKILLIVDDEKTVQEVLSSQFDPKEVEVLVANNGEDGLKLALVHHPDLILLDLVMPKMDGMAMLNRLRKDDWGKNAKVIILTNLNDTGEVAEAVSCGTDAYIVKVDMDIQEMVKKVRHALGLK